MIVIALKIVVATLGILAWPVIATAIVVVLRRVGGLAVRRANRAGRAGHASTR